MVGDWKPEPVSEYKPPYTTPLASPLKAFEIRSNEIPGAPVVLKRSTPAGFTGSIPAPRPLNTRLRTLWTLKIGTRLRGLVLARERGRLLAWDDNHWLYLLTHKGERQGQWHSPGDLAAVCCADDGSAYAAVGTRGDIWWLAPDLMPRWQAALAASGGLVIIVCQIAILRDL